MTFNPAHSQNFVDLLVRRAERHPERIALHCIADGDGAVLSYGFADLDRRARAVAAHLQTVCAPGDRALILLHSGIDYVAAFFGCLYAGVIAVPAYPPESQAPQHLKRVASILHDAQPKLVLSHTALLDSVNAALATRCVSQRPAAIAVDQIDNAEAAAWRMPVIARDALAFLQYTSGSTASPKGVMVGHDNLLANQRAIKHGFGIHEDDVFVSWLPLYHDMGLVGSLMQPLYSGIPLALMSPRHFLERPLRWLEAVSRFGGTISGGPDFAYRLCNERIGEAQLVGLRLDSWRLAFCGAEPIRHETLASFAEKFSIAGLPASAPYPCYGLAEASLLVSGGLPGEGAHAVVYAADALAEHRAELAESGSVIVDCGRVQPEHQLAIVDLASGLECDECRIGEIRFSGPSVTHGYWQNPAATLEAFVHEDGKTWLRTGDLGFVRDGRLFVAGRVKDMILIRGQNLYPQDIEQALEEQIKLLRKGRVAAFSVNVDGREGIGIAAEIGRGTQKRVPAENLFDAINDTLAQCCQQPATLILLLNPGALPKTSSGKLQRRACYQAWREGALDVYASQWDGQRQPEQAAAEELTDFERSVAMIWREVLNVTTVSAQQSFFALGGQSIAVIQAVAALSEQLGVTVEPALFFEKPKLREFAAVVEAQVNESATATVAPIAKGEQSEGLLLTYGQESLWFLMQLDPSSTAYHIAGGARIVGELDREVLTQAFGVLAQRHDALRTVFYAVDGQPRQRILPAFDVDLAYHDVRELPCDEAQAQAAQLAEQSARIPFDLERGPLWRMLLVRLPAQDGQACHELNLTLHHLIADGWSLNRLLAEFAECYGAIQAGREPRLPLLPIRHADFASWQRHWLEAGEAERQLAYWTEWLGGEQPVIELPYDRARPAEPSQRGGRVNFVLPEAVSQALPAVARQHGVTPFMLLLAAFNVLLYRYSGQNDLRIGLPLANRNRPETQHLIGYFVNTVVLRSQINAQSGFDTLLQHTKQTLLQAQAHPDLPFEHLVDALQPERRLGQNPLFQILINHQQTDIGLLAQHADWQIEALDRDNGAAQFDLSLDTWQDSRGRIGGFFTYASDLFDGATIERLAGHYQNLLAQLLAQPQAAIAAHGLLGGEEARQLQAWNTWPKTYDQQTPVHELIRRQAQAQPDALALIAGEASLSYAELDAQANRLAHRLLAEGLGRESRVALLLPRGIEAIAAMLAVLKAGAAYLPLDPEQPAQRLAELIADAGVSLILHQDYLHAQPTWLNLAGLDLSTQPATLPEVKIHPEQLAYLILTSGSTGKPKCVAVAHGALTRHIQAAGDLYRYTPADRALHFAAFTFDAAMEQWLAPLCHGAGVVLGFSRWTGEETLQAVTAHDVSVIYPPTSALLHLADAVSARGQTLALRIACVGGEAVSSAALAKIRTALQPEMIVNGYGPTETVITPLAWQADAREVTGYAPIGTALGERSLHILDPDLNPVSLGAVGELYLGGPCLARGYFGRADLTAERFIPDPFGADGGRLYRTGDLVRFGLDGIVAYLGRVDQQIKLRGYRIEPGEIEAALRQLPGVDDAHVLLRDDNGRRYLAAYLQPGSHDDIATDEAIRSALAARLPDYMVPARFIRLAQLPRTAHGKIDRRALPVPDAPARREPQAPTHPTEAVLVQLWQDLLGRHDIGIHDNFFELGGDSIISIQLVSRARAQGLRFTPKDLFQQQTIAGLARVVQRLNLDDPEQTEQAPATGPAPLLPIQHVFFEQQLPTPAHWNQSLLLKARRPLDRAALEPTLHALVEHHDSLRLRYVQQQGQWQQRYAEIQPAECLLEQHRAQDAAHIAAIAQQAQRSLNLEHGPLFKAVLIDVADGSQRLLLVAHHLIVDAVSWRLLLEDLHRLYQQIRQGQAPQLPAKTASYQAWGRALQNYAQSPGLQAQRGYWQAQGDNPLPNQENAHASVEPPVWPCDHPQGRAEARDRASQTLALSVERSRQLLHDANPAYRTRIQELLLAALAQTLCEWTRQTDIAVALEGHGREAELMPSDNPQAALDLSRTVGWFTSLYPVKLSPQTSAADTVKTVKEQLRRVPDRGLGYGVLHYLSPTNQHPADARHEASVNPARPRVLFNYLGQLDSSFSDDALLQPAAEDSGDERDPQTPLAYELEINGEIYQGQLRLHWSYSRERYQADTIKTLLERYQLHLNRLLDHCLQAEPTLTPSDVPLANLSQAQLDALLIPHAQIEDIYPLSPMQQGILFHALQHGEQDPYFYQRVFSLNGALDVARFHVAWQTAVDRRPALRSSYLFEDMQLPLQVVGKSRSVELRQADWRGLDADQHWRQLHSWLADERKQGFDFAGRRGFELSLLRVGDARWWLVWSHHHIALDGWSMGLVLRDVMRAYHDDAPVSQPDYADYLRWLASRDHAAALAFWRESLQGFNGSTPLPLPAEAMPAGERGSYREIETSLSIDETAQVQAAARRHGVTVSTLLQAAYALLLVRHGGGEALFGVTVSGRSANVDGIDEMAGLFINTLPLRVSLPGARDVTSWLQAIQRQAAAMRDYEFTPLVEIQRAAGCEGQNLFEAILVFENYPLDEVLKSQRDGLQVGLLDAEAPAGVLRHDLGRNNYPLSLIAGLDNHLHLTLSGERQRFLPGALELLAKRYRYLLQQLITVGVTTLADIQLQPLPAFSLAVADGEIALLSGVDVARGELDYPHVLAAWESHVIAQPDAIAVRDSIASLSFAELNRSAARLAAVLQGMGVNTETVVGVLFERSVQLPLSLLAVLKAGGVYLPLDPALPDSRLHDLLRDSGATVLLTGDADAPRFANCGVAVLNPDAVARTDGVAEFAAMPIHAEQAAYRIYTSGSTGHPKGVTVSHGALDRYLQGVLPRLDWPRTAILAMVSTPAADLSHTVLFGAMYSGCALVLIDAETAADPDRFAAAMRENQVDVLKIVPSHLRGLLQAANPADVLPNRLLILGGEACDAELLATVRRLKPGCRIVNHYGPTETTVGVLTHEVTAEAAPIVPVGTPLAGTCAYLLDADLNPLPNDVPGELYIGGGSLARAYHGKPGASAERFLPDPFHAGARMYRTGDRAILRGGRLVWLGRADDQVKIRGYRVEPGEVAKVLRGLPGVADALVIAEPNEQDGRLQLLAYAVAERAASLDIINLNTQLAALLPDYMLPAHLMLLEAIPLTANGKANRKALPRPQAKARSSVAPRNDIESKLAAIWQTVLKREPIGVTDNFFELGGDSILSLQIIARARKQGIKLTPKLLFEKPTIAELAAAGAVPVAENRQTAIPRLAVEGPRPLSYGQERLWFLAQLQPDNNAYHISGGLRIHGRLDDNALRLAFQGLAGRHAMLRTRFVEVDGKPMQLADAALALPLRILTGAEAVLSKTAESNVPFDFATGPMWRVALVKYGEDRHELWLTMHHILADGWSVGRLLEEFSELYAATAEGREAHLPTLAIEYADYAAWQRQWLAAGEGERQARYWQNQLGGEQPVLELPFDHPRPERMSKAGASHAFVLPVSVGQRLKQVAVQSDTTPFVVLFAAFAALLYRYSGQSDIRIGVPVANRQRLETEPVLGFFVNTLVIKAECRGDRRFQDWLAQAKQTVLAAQEHPDLPFEHLVELLQPERTMNRNPLFQVLFNHQKRDLSALNALPGLNIERIVSEPAAAQFDLSLATEEDDDGVFSGSFVYAAELFLPETITRLSEHFQRLLAGCLAEADQPLAGVDLLSEAERVHQSSCNATETAYPPGLAHELISQTATVQPDAPALLFGDAAMSYAELESRANRLAHYLIDLGVGPEMPIGIAVERSFELVVGLLAIVKAGGAYVPLDPDYPDERLAYMIEDSGIGLLLSHGAVIDKFRAICSTSEKECVAYDLDNSDVSGFPGSAPLANLHPSHPAYIIYTSGSTGRPKGATNTHAALANRLRWMQQAYAIGPNDTVLQKTPFSFDVSVWEFFWPLMTGARLAIAAPGAHRDPAALADTLRRQQVTTLHFVPSMLAEFVNQPNLPNFPALKRIVCSGEALSADLQQRVFERLPGVELNNLYGPTEAAIDVTHWTCRADGQASVPIGEAIANIQIHILDRDLNPQPAGVAGELYIGGIGLARGYHRRPGLSAERFLPDPFGSGGRLYRTGDLARRRADGVIDYLGRIDQQIKLRGLRIELGEIEAALLGQPGIQEAAVILKGAAGGPRLVAYLAANPEAADDTALQNALRRQLPDYMLPSALIRLDSLPKTANGKLDRKALPEPSWQGQTFRAPQSATEQTLAAIWQDLLGVEQVGLDDNFFQLGGHSLLAMKLAGRISQHFQIELGVRRVFEVGSLSVLAAEIDALLPASPTLDLQGELADALAELQGMSTEDLRALLAE